MVVASLADARWTESWWPSRDIAVAFVGASLATPVGYCRSRRPAKHGGRRQATPLRAPLVRKPTERIARRTESLRLSWWSSPSCGWLGGETCIGREPGVEQAAPGKARWPYEADARGDSINRLLDYGEAKAHGDSGPAWDGRGSRVAKSGDTSSGVRAWVDHEGGLRCRR